MGESLPPHVPDLQPFALTYRLQAQSNGTCGAPNLRAVDNKMSKQDNLSNITYVGHMLVTDLVAVISCRKALTLCLQRTISTAAGALYYSTSRSPSRNCCPLDSQRQAISRFDTQRSSTHEAPLQTSAKPAQVPLGAPRSNPHVWDQAAEATFWADLAILQAKRSLLASSKPYFIQLAQPRPQATSIPSYPAPSCLTPRSQPQAAQPQPQAT